MDAHAHEWVVAATAWDSFLTQHPELGYPAGKAAFHNFLRRHRETLEKVDALRTAKGRFWIAHKSKFLKAAFDCATGRTDLVVPTGENTPLPNASS